MPEEDEISAATAEALRAARVSHSRAIALCTSEFDVAELEAAAGARREDLRVHFALTLLPGAPTYRALPPLIQRDVRSLFGSHAQALAEARNLLFSAGSTEVVRAAAEQAQSGNLGIILAGDRFRARSDQLGQLPSVLRCVVGCAEALQGGIDNADVVEIRLDRPLVIAIACDDFKKPLPRIVERIQVNLARLRVEVRRANEEDYHILLPKAPLMPKAERVQQEKIEAKLVALGILEPGSFDPPESRLDRLRTVLSTGSSLRTPRGTPG